MELIKLENCHDCGAKPGQVHDSGCDVERCSVCGGKWIGCGCKGHDRYFARWTGIWPGYAECMALGLWVKWVDGSGWVKCSGEDPNRTPDLNDFVARGLGEIFFVKPKKEVKQINLCSKTEIEFYEVVLNGVLYRVKKIVKARVDRDYTEKEFEIVREISNRERSDITKIITASEEK